MSPGVAASITSIIILVLAAILFTWHQRRSEKLLRDTAVLILRGEEQARAAIAQELHDNLVHKLYDLQLRASNGEKIEAGAIRDLMGLTRQISRQLHSQQFERGDLMALLSELAAQINANWDVETTVDLAEDCPVNGEAALALYRISQEVLTNAHRHGKANTISISLQWSGKVAKLVVEDDGVGLGSPERRNNGLGVRSMEERMRSVGGRLTIGPGAGGRGVRVEAAAPQ